jgi:hypothetical protein
MTASLLFAGVGVAVAQGPEVYSLNVVGFQKVTVASNTKMMAATPFLRSPGNLDHVVGAQLTAGKSELSADIIATWNVVSQKYDRFWLRAADSNWYTVGATSVRATNVFLNPTTGFFIIDQKSTGRTEAVVLSGDVVDTPVATNALLQGMNLVSYPFSSSIDLNRSGLTNGRAGKSEFSSDIVSIWNPTSQVYRRYWLRNTDKKWYTVSAQSQIATGSIGGGQAFFYQRTTNVPFNWVEVKPYTL